MTDLTVEPLDRWATCMTVLPRKALLALLVELLADEFVRTLLKVPEDACRMCRRRRLGAEAWF
jgi:hypothetical protein